MINTRLVMLVLGTIYAVGVAALYWRGLGTLAAYATMPAWLALGAVVFVASLVTPSGALGAAWFSWSGNLALLLLSAGLNVVLAGKVLQAAAEASGLTSRCSRRAALREPGES